MDRLALQEKDAVVKAKKRTRPARSPRVWEEATPIKDKDVGTGSNSPCPSKSYTGQEDKMEKKGLEVWGSRTEHLCVGLRDWCGVRIAKITYIDYMNACIYDGLMSLPTPLR